MPAWLEVLLNLSGFAGFVALATCGASSSDASGTDPIHTDER